MFINDVGEGTWEEINDGIAGSNYGWPTCEGFCSPTNPMFRDPIFRYANDAQTCAITGGAFYNPTVVQFPASYLGDYFFSDFCGGWIRKLDPANGNVVTDFAAGISFPVDLKVTPDGSLYYLSRGAGAVGRIQFASGGGDITEPTVSITNPNDGATVARKSTVSIAATANDNTGVVRVEFLINGKLQCTDTGTPYNCSWKVPARMNKTYQIQARAFDLAGNAGTAAISVVGR